MRAVHGSVLKLAFPIPCDNENHKNKPANQEMVMVNSTS